MRKIPWKQLLFLAVYIAVHYACSSLFKYTGAEAPDPMWKVVAGEVGFVFYFVNLPFIFIIKQASYQVQSALSAVLYGLLLLYAFRFSQGE